MDDLRKGCQMRHENGNCTVIGGFCTAVNDLICEGLHSAYDSGYRTAAIHAQQERENPEQTTNADRIRAMSDEELAVLLADEIPHGDCYGCDLDCSTSEGDKFKDCCHNAFYKWLQQPAEGE